MAIVISEEQSGGGGFFSFVLWIVLLGLLAGGLYYLFFKDPGKLNVVAPAEFQDTERISKIDLNPEEVLSNERFTSLKDFLGPITPGVRGRSNPFLAQ